VNARAKWLVLGLVLACGNAPKKDALSIPPTASDAGASSGPSWVTTPPPSGLPPMAPMPPPGVVGSKKAHKKHEKAFSSCQQGVKPSKDLAAEVTARGKACEQATKMHPVGGVLRGSQSAGDPHSEFPLRVEAKRCYRVYLAADPEIVDVGLLIKDSNGDVAGEDAGLLLLEDGAVCFDQSDDAKVVVTVGSGKGSFAVQVWSD
jgi:hypothetical protein